MDKNEQRKLIEEVLIECKDEHEIAFKYQDIAKAFPGGSHPDSFECDKIATMEFQGWANERGWNVDFDKNTPKNPIPNVILTNQSKDV